MAITFAGIIKVMIDGLYKSTGDLGTAQESIGVNVADTLASGVGDLQADRWVTDQRTVTNPTTDTIDLTSTLADAFGNTFAPATLKGILIRHTGTTGNLTISGNAIANAGWAGASGSHLILPGGVWFVFAPNAGYTITNTTQDQLDVDSSAGAIVYDIYILGTST